MKKYKMIKVDADTHSMAKTKAIDLGMTLEGYIKMIVTKDVLKK